MQHPKIKIHIVSYTSFTDESLVFCFRRNRYPPYSEKKLNIVEFLMRKRKSVSLRCLSYVIVFALGFAAAYGVSAIIKVLELSKVCAYENLGPKFCGTLMFLIVILTRNKVSISKLLHLF
jgi:hypothetical protein